MYYLALVEYLFVKDLIFDAREKAVDTAEETREKIKKPFEKKNKGDAKRIYDSGKVSGPFR